MTSQRIVCVAAHLPSFAALAKLTIYGNRAEYCAAHGYTLKVKTDGWAMPAAHPVSWDRLKFLRDLLVSGEWDWAWCSGADVLITNFGIRLEDRTYDDCHVVAAADWCAPIQADSFLVRATPQGIGWLNDLLALYPKYKDNRWVENAAMIDTLGNYQGTVKILPQWMLNSYEYHFFAKMYPTRNEPRKGLDYFGHRGQWMPGDFVCHWPSLPLQVRVDEVRRMQPLIRRKVP